MTPESLSFLSPYRHGFVRVAVAIPRVHLGDSVANVRQVIDHATAASRQGAALVLFPELSLTGYSLEDLFQQETILFEAKSALAVLLEELAGNQAICIVGLPLQITGGLYNCAVVTLGSRILGVVPKTYLPNYREFYEKRQFLSAADLASSEIQLCNQTVPVGNDLIFESESLPGFTVHVEICEDLWSPIPPSTIGALGGATILANLSASNITVGKADYRQQIASAQSGKCIAAYLYSAAGQGESTTDLAWDGQALIYENGRRLAAGARFSEKAQVVYSDIDVEALQQDRMRMTSFNDTRRRHQEAICKLRTVRFSHDVPDCTDSLRRAVPRFPYVPSNAEDRTERCFEAYNIQVHGLVQRLRSTGIQKLVLGISGGLDSTQALIVAARAVDFLSIPRSNILAYTMPGFATSSSTKSNAHALMSALGTTAAEIDIRPSCMQMFKDLDHPYAHGKPVYDRTFENVQAGERTSHLFRLANYHNGLVVGTGDLSELALGWATYGVGDHMSHYNVNASVPKTLIQYLIRWIVDSGEFSDETNTVLLSILGTEISPELVPGSDDDDSPAQQTEAVIGPYELQDFHLYHLTRYGFRPSKVAYLAYHAWGDKKRGDWPDSLPIDLRNEYDIGTLKQWQSVFLRRFFQTSQFKRSCLPNGPKVGSGGSLSPRGDWRAPSDSTAEPWLRELSEHVPETIPE